MRHNVHQATDEAILAGIVANEVLGTSVIDGDPDQKLLEAGSEAEVKEPETKEPEVQEPAEIPPPTPETPIATETTTGASPEDRIKVLMARLEELLSASEKPKNQRPGTAKSTKYVLTGKPLSTATFSAIPAQQRDLAVILEGNMVKGQEYTEEEVFKILEAEYVGFPSLFNSRQHVTYLFRYYRGLKADKNHAGFVAREFLRSF